ncbi:MAG: glycosyltransferase [Lachnospiraceae bacterium]|nr:glycosyltransferase [Lachnospiraceae bacterium]
MKVIVNDIAASKTGALSVLKDFYECVKEKGKEHEWIFLLSDHYVEETDNISVIVYDKVKKSRKERLKFDYLYGKKEINALKGDVYFSMQNTLMAGIKARQVLYVHQPLGFQNAKNFSLFKAEEREYAIYQHIISKLVYSSIKRADKTIVQTKWMKDAIIKKTGVKSDKVVNIMPDVREISPKPNRDKRGPDQRLFFYPAAGLLYKNHECILRAIDILKKDGIDDFKVYLTLTKEELSYYSKGRVYENIVCLGSIEREKVIENYYSSVLLFPSYIETFGYPLMEGRMADTIILSSDCDFSREVLEGYDKAYFFDPFDPAGLAGLMKSCIKGQLKVKEDLKSLPADSQKTESSWVRVIRELTGWKETRL